jgi:uncharacterized damage-inducible protein DinB
MTVMRIVPPSAADERTTLEAFLDRARATVHRKCEGLGESDEHRAVLPSAGMTLAGIVSHLRWVEASWFEVALRGEKNCAPYVGSDDPDQDFFPDPGVPLAQLLDEYEAQCLRSREICRTLSLDTAVDDEGVRFSVRWILFHMLEETARHLGHIDAVRELLDGVTGS